MKLWLHRIEVMVDAMIPYLLIFLAFLLLGQMFIPASLTPYAHAIEIYDWFVIICFATDLTFKYLRIRNVSTFVHRYWLDIIATLPIFLVLRTVEEIAQFSKLLQFQEQLQQPQVIMHESLVMQRQVARIIGEAERVGEVSRFERFGGMLERFPRFIRGLPFFEKPTGKHHHAERKPVAFASHQIILRRNKIIHRLRKPIFR